MWPCGKLQTYAGWNPALSAGEAYIKNGWMDVVTVINTTVKELYFQFKKKKTQIFCFSHRLATRIPTILTSKTPPKSQSESLSLDHLGFLAAASSSSLLSLRLLAEEPRPDVDGVSVSTGKEEEKPLKLNSSYKSPAQSGPMFSTEPVKLRPLNSGIPLPSSSSVSSQ